MIELKREADILSYMNDVGYEHIVPTIRSFKIMDSFAYLIEDYFNGRTVREEISMTESLEERLKIWEKVGQVLSEIHMIYRVEDIENEWLDKLQYYC